MITSGDLAARIAPALAAAIEARKGTIIDGAQTGPLGRWVLGKVWPRIIGEVPNIAGAAVDAIRAEFGTMSLNDVLDWLGDRP